MDPSFIQFSFRQRITKALNAAGVEIAVPQRNVTLGNDSSPSISAR